MDAMARRWSPIKALSLFVFSLVCAVLMILAAWWKRGTPVGSPLHTALEWSIPLLVVLAIVGISVSGLASRHPSGDGQAR
jgi:hypothetical protein